MTHGPGPWSGDDNKTGRSWTAKPLAAATARALLLLTPFLVGWLAVRVTRQFYLQPAGWIGLAIWIMQAVVVAFVSTAMSARAAERFAPLPLLFGMTLAFPDHAPSRFGIALRAGSAKRLIASSQSAANGPPTLTDDDPQQAAEEALALVTRLRDHEPSTRGHTERVRAYAELIGREMDLSKEDINGLRWGMLLHDIGKLGVPAEILSKPGVPTEEEWRVLKTHPTIGGEMIKPLEPWLGEWTMAASQHHERWDGTGYPAGLSGSLTSLVSRIAAVADAYDVMTSRRSYKAPRSAEDARRELVACSGTHFDPAVVRAFLRSGLGTPKHRLGIWSWIMELPGLARLGGSIANIPITAVPAVVAVLSTAAPGVPLAVPTEDLTFAEASEAEPDSGNTPGGRTESARPPTRPAAVPSTPSSIPLSTPLSTRAPEIEADGEPQQSTIAQGDDGTGNPTGDPSATVPNTTVPNTESPGTQSPSTSTQQPTNSTNVAPSSTTTTTAATTTTVPANSCQQLLAGETELPGADLVGCDFAGRLTDGLDLRNADLTNADLSNVEMTNFNLQGANLTGANLSQAVLRDGSLVGANLSTAAAQGLQVLRVDLGYVTANGADFRIAGFDQVSFGFAQFTDSLFVGAAFQGVNFNDGTISGSDFSTATMNGTEFWRVTAIGTRFVDTQMEATLVGNADLTNANLSGADLRSANLEQTNLSQANLSNADFFGATGTPSSSAAIYNATVCPSGAVQSTSCW